jgi:hypothetical protein
MVDLVAEPSFQMSGAPPDNAAAAFVASGDNS